MWQVSDHQVIEGKVMEGNRLHVHIQGMLACNWNLNMYTMQTNNNSKSYCCAFLWTGAWIKSGRGLNDTPGKGTLETELLRLISIRTLYWDGFTGDLTWECHPRSSPVYIHNQTVVTIWWHNKLILALMKRLSKLMIIRRNVHLFAWENRVKVQ